jgi:peptidoglycan/xylan/chitin deacetylase (PgdA/CDA1 family)
MGSGVVYTLGLDLKDAVLRPQAGRHFRGPSTGFVPGADVWPLVFRGWYEGRSPFWVRLRALPGSSKAALILTHAIGWGSTLEGAEAFARIEEPRGVRATWFVQTRVAPSALEAPPWDGRMRKLLSGLAASGHEIAAHTVSHGPDLRMLPFGTGEEVPEDYRPSLDADGRTRGGTLMGEVRVPKLLLEAVPGARVEGLRAAFKAYPDHLDAAAARAGYKYDSSLSAGQTLGYFPFRLMPGRGMDRESAVVELPMGMEDEDAPDDPMDAGALLGLLGKTAANECPLTLLVHPNASPQKRASLIRALDGLPAGTSVLTAGEAARFWEARSRTRFSFERKGGEALLRVWAPTGRNGLSFEVSRRVSACSSSAKVRCSGRLVVLEESAGGPVDVRMTLE